MAPKKKKKKTEKLEQINVSSAEYVTSIKILKEFEVTVNVVLF